MHTLTRVLGAAMLAVLIGEPVAALPALAQSSMSATAVTLSGTVTDGAGSPVSGATITLSGPATAMASSDANGHYSVSAPPGLYKVVVHASGFSDSSDDSVTIDPSGSSSLDVRLTRPSLSSIQTIGTVRSSGNGGPAFNSSPAAESIISAQTFSDQGDIAVRNVLDETPGIVVSVSNGSANGGVRGSINYSNIRGGLSYETASLLDGHAVSVGKYGDYVTTFLNSAMFQTVEVVKGPGALPPEINRSVNGTVNFRTWDPTVNFTGNLTYGLDGFGGDFSNARFSDSVLNKKLGFVLDFATEGTPGAGGNVNPRTYVAGISDVSYTNSAGVPVTVSPVTEVTAPGQTAYSQLATNTIACCVNIPTWYSNKSELAKLRYNFSDVTQFTATMLASQTYASQNGNNNNLFQTQFNPSTPSAYIPSGVVQAFEPYNDAFAQDYEINNEPLFQGEFRTQFHNDTILARFYSASIGRLQTNGDQSNSTFTQPVQLYGVSSTGQPLTGNDPYGNPYIATITDPLYQSMEQDNLTGYTLEYNHQLGNSGDVLTASADENYSATHVYTPGSPDTSSSSNIAAGSQQNTGTFRLYGTFLLGPKITATAGYYLSRFDTHFADLNSANNAYIWSDNIDWHSDERVAFTWEPVRGTSVRLAAGSALVSPYLGILSGSTGNPTLCTTSTCPVGYTAGSVYVQSVGGYNVKPETSFGYDLGMDHRFNQFPDTVFSGDLYLTNLQNQFLKSTYIGSLYSPGGGAPALPLATTAYSNLANARYEGIEAALTHKPPQGWGWVAQGAFIRSYAYDVPPSIYQYNAAGQATTNAGLVAGANFGPSVIAGGSAIPYAQGYAELNFTSREGWYGNLGMLYFGNNNTFNDPAFEVVRGTLRIPILGVRKTYVQFSVDNIFNTNPEIFDVYGAGVAAPAVGYQTYATNLKGYGPRNFHLSLVHNF